MSATDEPRSMLYELCRLLNERGVEWRSFFEDGPDAPICMGWVVGERAYRVYRIDGRDGTLCIDGLTPEQAIAATLGDVDLAAENAKLRELVRDVNKAAHMLCEAWEGSCSKEAEGMSLHAVCPISDTNELCVFGKLYDRMRELGVEVDG